MTKRLPPDDFPHIWCTVDVVLLTLIDRQLHVALLQRANAPFQGEWALPGGYIHAQTDADAHAAAKRVLADKLGVHGAYLAAHGPGPFQGYPDLSGSSRTPPSGV